MSTHDLLETNGFLLLTGPSGQEWCQAAERLASELELSIRSVRIGADGDATDPTGEWAGVRDIEDGGAVLARPDGHVAFRSRSGVADAYSALNQALSIVLNGTPVSVSRRNP